MPRKKIHIGTSGWIYDDWMGTFYPEGVKGTACLTYYQQAFDTVEINATFYRTPTEKILDSWNRRMDPSFHLVAKGARTVTHYQRLKSVKKPLKIFLDRVLKLKTLEVILWQLPPGFHKEGNLKRVDRFLAGLPKTVRHAVEFRHPSWWQQEEDEPEPTRRKKPGRGKSRPAAGADPDPEVVEVLKRHNAAFVSVSHPSLPGSVVPTADFLYLRFHGLGRDLYRYNYSQKELEEWVARVKPHLRGRDLYAFFNNDYNANAPRNAQTFRDLLEPRRRRS